MGGRSIAETKAFADRDRKCAKNFGQHITVRPHSDDRTAGGSHYRGWRCILRVDPLSSGTSAGNDVPPVD
jgi:hypothetical protein